MKKGILLQCMLVLLCLPLAAIQAKENTPMETFINQVKETNKFVTVSNLWQGDKDFDQSMFQQFVKKATPLTIDYSHVAGFIKENNAAINLVIPRSDGSVYTIELGQYNILSNEFEVHTKGLNNTDTKVAYTPGLYYRGVVNGKPGSVAAFSFFNNEVYGIFSIPGEGNYVLVPNTQAGEYYNYNQHYILYNDKDLTIFKDAPGCATDLLPTDYIPKAKTTTTLNNKVYNNCTNVKVYEVADYAMFVKKGNSATNVTNYLTALFNNQGTMYANEGIPIVLKYVEINSVTDPYQAITTLQSIRFLKKFGYITQNNMHDCDVAMLMSTRSGNMGGVAWLMSVCSGYWGGDTAGPYGFCNVNNSSSTSSTAFPTFSWDVDVAVHEMGHIVGSPHTHACCWNPPARNTAIDGCATTEGSCADPGNPAGGGTIMSYCHNTGVGTNFSLGFGQQPGDTIRSYLAYVFPMACGAVYYPTASLSKVNRTISANKECTDMNTGITYYFKDNNTISKTDDTLVLMIKKNGNNIGNLNTSGFSVSINTVAGYGSGTADTILFPTGMGAGTVAPNYSMHRYWKVNATTAPTSNVEVIFPFLPVDSSDIDGSAAGHPAPSSYRMYKVHSPINPNPNIDSFRYTTSSNVSIYTNGTTASATRWSLSKDTTTYYAHMLMTKLSGGGAGYYNTAPTDLDGVSAVSSSISIYPNPTNSQWFVAIEKSSNTQPLTFQLYTADGKMIHVQSLENGAVNTVSTSGLSTGMYFYRIISNDNTYTGTLVKR